MCQYRYILLLMAKVMISLPDELVGRIDEQARRRGTTRSGLLRDLAERELASDVEVRRRGVRELLAAAASHGGDGARHVREQRRAR
jgi:metal-responsive CopG/Arc/MetJ family transcriptional regulator